MIQLLLPYLAIQKLGPFKTDNQPLITIVVLWWVIWENFSIKFAPRMEVSVNFSKNFSKKNQNVIFLDINWLYILYGN